MDYLHRYIQIYNKNILILFINRNELNVLNILTEMLDFCRKKPKY